MRIFGKHTSCAISGFSRRFYDLAASSCGTCGTLHPRGGTGTSMWASTWKASLWASLRARSDTAQSTTLCGALLVPRPPRAADCACSNVMCLSSLLWVASSLTLRPSLFLPDRASASSVSARPRIPGHPYPHITHIQANTRQTAHARIRVVIFPICPLVFLVSLSLSRRALCDLTRPDFYAQGAAHGTTRGGEKRASTNAFHAARHCMWVGSECLPAIGLEYSTAAKLTLAS